MPFTGGERHWQLQIPAHSADRTRHSRGADSRARRKTSGWYRLALKWHQPPNLSLRGGRRPTWQSREGSCDFADGFPVVRPCSARLPRRFAPRNDTSGWRAVHQCTCAVELPSARCSGNAAAFPIGAISRFLRKKIPEAQASGNFSLSKKSLWAFSPSCFQNCIINFCSMILQFCRCGGLWNAKGNPDGFLSHFPSLRDFRLGRFL